MNTEVNEIKKIMVLTYHKDISGYDESFLIKSLEKRAFALGVELSDAYIRYLTENSFEADMLFNALNITYSDFFRNPLTFALLEQWIIPLLIHQKKGDGEIRIWSAGCSAGQEAYSLAMLMDKYHEQEGQELRYRIFATDISQSALALAREGLYSKDMLQNVKLKQFENYFTNKNGGYQIASRLRESINFSTYDLLDADTENPAESIYGEFDIVICSNLLFYYKPDIQQFILRKACKSMAGNGYLITGEAERDQVNKIQDLQMVSPPAAIFQKRKMRGVQ